MDPYWHFFQISLLIIWSAAVGIVFLVRPWARAFRGEFRLATTPTNDQIIKWATDLSNSCSQIQKAYDWQISQWGTMGNAILTAVLGLVSSAFIEYYKTTLLYPGFWRVIGFGVLTYTVAYVYCRREISRLRMEFLAIYTLLLSLRTKGALEVNVSQVQMPDPLKVKLL